MSNPPNYSRDWYYSKTPEEFKAFMRKRGFPIYAFYYFKGNSSSNGWVYFAVSPPYRPMTSITPAEWYTDVFYYSKYQGKYNADKETHSLDNNEIIGSPPEIINPKKVAWSVFSRDWLTSYAEYKKWLEVQKATKRGSRDAGLNLNIERRVARDEIYSLEGFYKDAGYFNAQVYKFYNFKAGDDFYCFVPQRKGYVNPFHDYNGKYKMEVRACTPNEDGIYISNRYILDYDSNKNNLDYCGELFHAQTGITSEEYSAWKKANEITKQGSEEAGLNLNIESTAVPFTEIRTPEQFAAYAREHNCRVYKFEDLVLRDNQVTKYSDHYLYIAKPSKALDSGAYLFYALEWGPSEECYRAASFHRESPDIWAMYERITSVGREEYLNYIQVTRTTQKGSKEAGLNLNIESSSDVFFDPVGFKDALKKQGLKAYRFYNFKNTNYPHFIISSPKKITENRYLFYYIHLHDNGWKFGSNYFEYSTLPTVWSFINSTFGITREEYLKWKHLRNITYRGSQQAGMNLNVETVEQDEETIRRFKIAAQKINRRVYEFFDFKHSQKPVYVYIEANPKTGFPSRDVASIRICYYVPENYYFRGHYAVDSRRIRQPHTFSNEAAIARAAFIDVCRITTKEYSDWSKVKAITDRGSEESGLNLNIESSKTLDRREKEILTILRRTAADHRTRVHTFYDFKNTNSNLYVVYYRNTDEFDTGRESSYTFLIAYKNNKGRYDYDINSAFFDNRTISPYSFLYMYTLIKPEEYKEWLRARSLTKKGSKEAGLNLNIESTDKEAQNKQIIEWFYSVARKHKRRVYAYFDFKTLHKYLYFFVNKHTSQNITSEYYEVYSLRPDYNGIYVTDSVGRVGPKMSHEEVCQSLFHEFTSITPQEYDTWQKANAITRHGTAQAGMNLDIESFSSYQSSAK